MTEPSTTTRPCIAAAAAAGALLLAALTCHKVNVITPPAAPNKPILPSSAEVDDTCVASVYTGYDSTVCAVRLAWGDGDTTAWLPDSSSDTVTARHGWYWGAQFLVTAQARNAWGVLSNWSAPCTVAVTGLPPFADSLLDSVAIDEWAWRLVVSPEGERCYIFGYDNPTDSTSRVRVVRLADMALLDSIRVPGEGTAACCSPDGQYVYVAWWRIGGDSTGVVKVRTQDDAVVAQMLLPDRIEGLAASPDNGQIWAADYNNNRVLMLSASDLGIVDSTVVSSGPIAVAFDSAGAYAFVAYDAVAELTVIDATTKRLVRSIPLEPDGVLDMVSLPSSNRLYVIIDGYTCNYQLIDLIRQQVDFSFDCEDPIFDRMSAAPAGDWLYLASEDESYIAVARAGEDRIRACFPVRDSLNGDLYVWDVAALPDGRLLVLDDICTLRLYGPSSGAGSACIPKAIRSRSAE